MHSPNEQTGLKSQNQDWHYPSEVPQDLVLVPQTMNCPSPVHPDSLCDAVVEEQKGKPSLKKRPHQVPRDNSILHKVPDEEGQIPD
ncbi:hypothetical protein KTT_29050 [Tengunoibacter tsumagoiensis]|uniref:Uncharacterized protein n=1 Tax=Tengunoibacter tsumagoiensis TaxID=2014871 RepID=A0A402A1W0_9CHLR|nr:hypothetical protein KTT_29050 [Tengunoibacter tsumagoiensis]